MLDPLNKWPYSNNVPNQSHIDFTGIQSCKENVRFPHCANKSKSACCLRRKAGVKK